MAYRFTKLTLDQCPEFEVYGAVDDERPSPGGGWAVPLFTRRQGETVVAGWNAQPYYELEPAYYDEAADEFVFPQYDEAGEPTVVRYGRLEPGVYEIGPDWVWLSVD